MLNKVYLRIGFNVLAPIAVITKRFGNGSVQAEGMLISTASLIFDNLNIKYEFFAPKRQAKEMAKRLPNGTWTGLMGKLQKQEIDVFLGPYPNTWESSEDFKPSGTIIFDSVSILASLGESSERSFFSFLFTVDPWIWYFLALAFLSLNFVSLWTEKAKSNKKSIGESFHRVFWILFAALLSEGSRKTVDSRTGQFLLSIWLLSVLILSNVIVSQFKAALVEKENDDLLRTVQDVADRPDLIPQFVNNSAQEQSLSLSKLDSYQKIYKRALKNIKKSSKTYADMVSPAAYQDVKDGKTVFFISTKYSKCALPLVCLHLTGSRTFYFLQEEIFPHQYSIYYNKQFPDRLYRILQTRAHKLTEGGFMDHWLSDHSRNYWKCVVKEPNADQELGFSHLSSVFFLLLICHLISTTALILELICVKYFSTV